MTNRVYYIVTFIPFERSEPVEERVTPETGDPSWDMDDIIERHAAYGNEVIHVRWSVGGTLYTGFGIDP